jgi:ubiquinone/menaquinone biosynthesis C-methylase UbiE
MEKIRKPAQGVLNIIQFNWHFFAISLATTLILMSFQNIYCNVLCFLIFLATTISLAVSYFVYDFSGFYELKWLDQLSIKNHSKIINIHAGFDETSLLLSQKYSDSKLLIYDFYDENKHTEISIKRARKAYPNLKETLKIETAFLPNNDAEINLIFLIFAAHEIRTDPERIEFFKELNRILKPEGQIIIVEHLRDLPNFMAYNFGFFHFLSKKTWSETFTKSSFKIIQKTKHTPFVNIYSIEKHGITP